MIENKLIGHDSYIENFVMLYKNSKLPSKILLSGKKGIGKSLLIKHFLLKIFNSNNDHELIKNMSHPNILNIKKNIDKKNIEIDQIREVVKFTNQSSFNNKSRFIIVDDAEFLNLNSSNALLKNLEEPNDNVFFILVFNSDMSVLDTIKSRCIEYKINITNEDIKLIVNDYFNEDIYKQINSDLINYYSTPFFLISLINYMIENELSISSTTIDDLLINLINNKHYLKQDFIKDNLSMIIEIFFYIHINKTKKISNKVKDYYYSKLSNVRKFNLDYEAFFLEFKDKLLNE
tara:strand:+ start:1849 stop:2718 length:870 start_codon:yes stop_codon:yes gene_type:complete